MAVESVPSRIVRHYPRAKMFRLPNIYNSYVTFSKERLFTYDDVIGRVAQSRQGPWVVKRFGMHVAR